MASLRDLGNECFKAGEFREAEQYYTLAISEHSRSDPKVFANRSLTRIRLQEWDSAELDARKAIELYGPHSENAMKAHYYLAQALMSRRKVREAIREAKTAYQICLDTKDPSSQILSGFVLRCKQALWQSKETARLRDLNTTLATVEELLDEKLRNDILEVEQRFGRGELGETGKNEEKDILKREADERRRDVRSAFSDPGIPDSVERAVPDYLVDAITFEIMHDPVVTPSGNSYERVGLLKHIRTTGTDPISRQPLTEKQLISNIALKQACSEFLEQNGWAVDY